MTRKLYNENSMIHEFEATVIDCKEYKNSGEYKIILDQTAFFPTGGGQTADAGWLSFCTEGEEKTVEVIDGKDAGQDVWHITNVEIPVGTKLKGKLDWKGRFSKMQQHTGEHIVSGIICEKYGFANVGFHLGEDTVTMDFDGELNEAQLEEIECLANQVVWECLPIQVLYPDKVELATIDYRSKIDIEGQVRIVQIPSVDSCACCAPHVLTTGMVGMIKFIDVVKHRGGVRITLACGDRALSNHQNKCFHSKQISRTLSAKENEISSAVDRLNKECVELRYKLKSLESKMVDKKVTEVLNTMDLHQESVTLFDNEFHPEQNKTLVNLLLEGGVKTCISFVSTGDNQYQFIAAAHDSDVRPVAALLREVFGAKGGGSAQMVQGRLDASKEEIINALEGLSI